MGWNDDNSSEWNTVAGPLEYIPADWTDADWPTQADWLGSSSKAIAAVEPYAMEALESPIAVEVIGLKDQFEKKTGLPIAKLASLGDDLVSLAQSTDVPHAVAGLIQVVSGVAQTASTIASATGVASAALEVIPVVAQIAGIVADVVLAAANYPVETLLRQQACDDRAAAAANKRCPELVSQARPVPTGKGGPSPADMFRPILYWYKVGGNKKNGDPRLPLCPASVYVALCGDAADGLVKLDTSYRNSKRRSEFLAGGSTRANFGIPRKTREQMWLLIKSIMAAAEPPVVKGLKARFNDGGAALYPVLQDLVRVQLLEQSEGKRKFGVDRQYLRDIADAIADEMLWDIQCKDLQSGAGQIPHALDSCRDRVHLDDAIHDGLLTFEGELRAEFGRDDGDWNVLPRGLLRKLGSAMKRKKRRAVPLVVPSTSSAAPLLAIGALAGLGLLIASRRKHR